MTMKVNRKQASHFQLVVGRYQCSPEEVEDMKAAYERDPEGAAMCFAELAAQIERMDAGAVEAERSLDGEQFLRLGRIAREMEADRDAQ